MKISIIVPSLREQQLLKCVESIITTTSGIDYEIIIISPFRPPVPCVWLKEEKPKGVNYAVERGYRRSKGEWIFVMSDEDRFTDGFLLTLYKFALPHAGKLFIANPVLFGGVTTFDRPSIGYYGKMFAPFPFIQKESAEKLGGLYDLRYKSFFADPDLSLRCWEAGGEVRRCDKARLYHPHIEDKLHMAAKTANFDKDQKAFAARWAHLGELTDARRIQ